MNIPSLSTTSFTRKPHQCFKHLLNSFLLKDSSVSVLITKSNSFFQLDLVQSSKPANHTFLHFITIANTPITSALVKPDVDVLVRLQTSADMTERDSQIYITDNYHP